MRILSITAGAGGMYCGSCLRDNALASELIARGHEVTLVPLYTPLRTDEANVTERQVLFGGISVYLQHYSSIFRKTPRFVDRLLDAPWLISAVADRSVSTDPRLLGGLTLSMLEGTHGPLRKEFEKLLDWIAGEPTPDIVNLTNSMLIAFARPLADALGRPVYCTLQGEDLFINTLHEPYRARALELMRQQVKDVAGFTAVSEYYRGFMAKFLATPAERIAVVPLGINVAGFERGTGEPGAFRVGYFARIAPEKGLHVLADAFVRLKRRVAEPVRLEAAGYLAAAQKPYLAEVRRTLERAGVGGDFKYHGEVDRSGKAAFLRSVDVLSVPATYDEPKGLSLLEAMASGVPVVQPRRGSFTELVENTGGGILVPPDDPDQLAEGLHSLWRDPARRQQLGSRGYDGVRAQYTIRHAADRLLAAWGRS